MWWVIGFIVACGVALLTGAFIRQGNPWEDHEDDYMIGDEEPDEGDRS